MKLSTLMNAATNGEPKRLRPMILWTILEYAFRGAPYGISLFVVWELFRPLENPGTALDISAVAFATGSLLVSLVLLYLVNRKSYFAAYYDSYEICAEGRLAIAEHLRKLSMGFYNSRDPGDVGAYLVTDYANMETLISHLLPQLFGAVVMPAVLLVCLAFFSWKLAAIAALVIPLALPFSWISRKILIRLGKKHQKIKVDAASRMIEYLQGIKPIKAYGLTGKKFDRLEKAFRDLKRASIRLEAGAGPTVILSTFVLNGGLTLIVLVGLSLFFAGEVSLPVYLMFLILGPRVYEPLTHALMFAAELNYFELGVRRVEDLRTTTPLPEPAAAAAPSDNGVEFRNVTFRYHKTEVLKNVSFRAEERSLTALVGPSGSGKTTVTRLLARFWDANEGEVLVGGRNVKDLGTEALLSRVSMVFQDVYLFNDTILDNIKFGRKNATREEAEEAARKAGCHEFISALPEGYDTLVGEGGSTLSGGEKQRISIARAILKDAPIVLLDEATASLDPENELSVQEAILELIRDKTVIVIAHRLGTIIGADRIVVFDAGKVVEQGSHEELYDGKGLYRHMWDEQMKVRGWKFRGERASTEAYPEIRGADGIGAEPASRR